MIKTILSLYTVLLFGVTVFAQSGTLDTSFDPGTGADNYVSTTAIQNDEKIILGGNFTNYNGAGRIRIARLNPDGSLDTSFDPGTGANTFIHTIAIQNDGKIIIGGDFTNYDGTGRNRIARLNTDGTLDTSFDPGLGANAVIYTSAIQNDGKIIIGGNFTNYDGTGRFRIARLNSDGSLDTSFDPGSGAGSSHIRTMVIQNDGKIIIGGEFIYYNGITRNRIARLNADGSLDTSFDTGSDINNTVVTVALQNDGKIIIGGYFTNYNNSGINRIARLNSDGSSDITFNPGTGANSNVNTSAIQNDGKIVVGGQFTSYNGTGINCIARLNSDGSLDTSFASGTGANIGIYTTAIQNDGKIVIGGTFTDYNGIGINRIARLNVDGCAITNIDVEEVTCTSQDVYSVTLTVFYENAPTSGTLNVANFNFPITGSPQTITLNNLNSAGYVGNPVTSQAFFSAEASCEYIMNNFWVVPDCSEMGVDELDLQNIVSLYPIPVISTLYIEVNENTKIKIINLLGETVATQQLHTGNNNVDVSSFSNGIYFLNAENGTSIKFIKQ